MRHLIQIFAPETYELIQKFCDQYTRQHHLNNSNISHYHVSRLVLKLGCDIKKILLLNKYLNRNLSYYFTRVISFLQLDCVIFDLNYHVVTK